MIKLYVKIVEYLKKIVNSIAFYPTIFAIGSIFLALGVNHAEKLGLSSYILEYAPWFVIEDVDTARSVLTTLIGGGISMLVFSFSMVMSVLSQAASNYSPRVLPGLISNKKNQIVLGIFLSTIVYNLIIIINIEPTGKNDYQVPGFAVILGIIFTLVATAAFIYFINAISNSIQINSILKSIFNDSKSSLERIVKEEGFYNEEFPDTNEWYEYSGINNGTIQDISLLGMLGTIKSLKTRIDILAFKGQYTLADITVFRSEKKLSEEEVTQVLSNFTYSETELVSDNYVLGFKQITEIGIKAMSPGINDPGTAINSIDRLTELFALRLRKKDYTVMKNDEEEIVLNINMITFNDLLYQILAPFRQYAKHDITVVQKLMTMLSYLSLQPCDTESYRTSIAEQASILLTDCKPALSNPIDYDIAKRIYDRVLKD